MGAMRTVAIPTRNDRLHLLSEKGALERLLEETTADEVLDRASLMARLRVVEEALAQTAPDEREPDAPSTRG